MRVRTWFDADTLSSWGYYADTLLWCYAVTLIRWYAGTLVRWYRYDSYDGVTGVAQNAGHYLRQQWE